MKYEDVIRAGQIASEIKKWIKPQIKKGTPLLEIAEKIEGKILEMKATPAFPVNLSINEIAAHYTPSHDDKTTASGLLKVDFGVNVSGAMSDTAFSLDLENNETNKKLIEASEFAVKSALKKINKKIELGEIGKTIEDAMKHRQVNPIVNLSGHSMEEEDLHSGITVPNFDTKDKTPLGEGLFAIEPFATTGSGKVHDGARGNIFLMIDTKNPRSPTAREALEIIYEKYGSLPFASRWLVKDMGTRALLGIKELEQIGDLHNFAVLVEDTKAPVAQTEETVYLEKDQVIITTE